MLACCLLVACWLDLRGEGCSNIYPVIYTPLPNSTRLHNTALRYMRIVKLGAYMWPNGLNWVKTGSKMGTIHSFVHPERSRITFGKMHF